jgi:acyl carrier protein
MPLDQIYAGLTTILRDVFDDDELVARAELTADQVDGWDSFAHLRLILTVERTFRVRFSAAEVDSLKNVGELAALVQTKLAA